MARRMDRVGRNEPALGPLLGDFRLLVVLFVAFRLMMLMVYQPLVVDGVERGLGAGGDALYYYQLASLVQEGQWPYLDWWHEFPPIASHLFVAVYLLSGGDSHAAFTVLFGVIMLVFDTGNLLLVRKLGGLLYSVNTGAALAWVYAVLLAPAVFIWWNFEPMVVFLTLLALWWLLSGRVTRSALAVAVGALLKFTPALLLGAVWRFRQQAAMRYTLVALGVFAAVYAAFFLRDAEMTLPSLTAQMNKASYQTVWALLDGNYRTGNFGSVQSHLDPESAGALYGEPALFPGWLRLAAAAAVGLVVFARTRRFDSRGLVAFVTITIVIFFLQSQGWSPQWLAQLIPLGLLCFPSKDGVLALVVLSLLVFAEYPVLFVRTGDTGGAISGELFLPFVLLVVARTGLLVALSVALYRTLRQEPIPGDRA